MRHGIVEGEPGSMPYHEWRLMVWIRDRLFGHQNRPGSVGQVEDYAKEGTDVRPEGGE